MSGITAPMGFLAKNWPSLNDNNPAVIVNPDAHPLDVLAWCWGEVESLRHAADAVDAALESGQLPEGSTAAIFVHRLPSISRLMELSISALARDKDCMSAVLPDEEGGAV